MNLIEDFNLLIKIQANMMNYSTPPNIILHKSKEIIFYISNNYKSSINIDLWKKELNLVNYKGLVIHSKCIFNRLKNDASLSKSYKQ